MGPEFNEIVIITVGFAGCFCDSLENFGDISEIINIMGFCWSWEELFGCLNRFIKLNG